MSNLVIKDMNEFIALLKRAKVAKNTKESPPHMQELDSAWNAISKGCACRKKQRLNHAIITY